MRQILETAFHDRLITDINHDQGTVGGPDLRPTVPAAFSVGGLMLAEERYRFPRTSQEGPWCTGPL
jgi:hypothetical protein